MENDEISSLDLEGSDITSLKIDEDAISSLNVSESEKPSPVTVTGPATNDSGSGGVEERITIPVETSLTPVSVGGEQEDGKKELSKAPAQHHQAVQNGAVESSPRLPASSSVVTPGSRTSGVHPVGQGSEEQKKAQELPSESLLSPRSENPSPAANIATSGTPVVTPGCGKTSSDALGEPGDNQETPILESTFDGPQRLDEEEMTTGEDGVVDKEEDSVSSLDLQKDEISSLKMSEDEISSLKMSEDEISSLDLKMNELSSLVVDHDISSLRLSESEKSSPLSVTAPSDFDAVSQSAVIEGAEEPADKKNELAKASAEHQQAVETSPPLHSPSPVVTSGSATSGVILVGLGAKEMKKAQEAPSESQLSPTIVNSSPAAIVTTSDSADAAQWNEDEAEEPAFVNPTQDSHSSVILNGTQSEDDDQEMLSDNNNDDGEEHQPENNDETSGSNSFSWIHKKKRRVTCKEDTSTSSVDRRSPASAPENFFAGSPEIQSPFANMFDSFGDSFRSETSTTDELQRKQRRTHGKDDASSSSVGPHPFGSDADEGDAAVTNDDVENLLEKTAGDSKIENEQLETVTSAEGETPKKKSGAAPKKKKERFLPGLFGSEESVVDGQKKTSSDTALQPASSAAPHPELTRRRKRKAISRTTGGKNSQNSGGNTRTRGKKGAKKAIGEEFVEMLEEVKSRLTNEVKCYKLSHLLQCETRGELLRQATSKRIDKISKIMDNRKMKTHKLRILTSRWHFCLSRETADHAEPARVLIIDGCARILSFKQNGLTAKEENTLVQAMVTVVEAKEFQLLWEASTPLVAEEEEEDEEERRNKAGCGLLNVFLHYFSSLSGDDGEQYTAMEKFILVKGAADELIPAAERDQVPDDRIEGITTAMVKQGLIEKSLTWALQLSFCHPLSLAVAKDILQTKKKFYIRGHFPVLVGKASRKNDEETANLLQLLHDGEADPESVAEELHYLLGDVANRRIRNGGLSKTLPSSSIIIQDFPTFEEIPANSVIVLFEEQVQKADLVDWIEAVDHSDALAVFVVCQGSSAVLQTEFIDWVNEATGSTRRWFQTLRVRERITLVACVSGDGLLFADGKKETRLEKLLEEHVESGLLILRPTGDPPRKEKTPAKSDINATSPH